MLCVPVWESGVGPWVIGEGAGEPHQRMDSREYYGGPDVARVSNSFTQEGFPARGEDTSYRSSARDRPIYFVANYQFALFDRDLDNRGDSSQPTKRQAVTSR